MEEAFRALFEELDTSRGIPALLGDGAGNVAHPRIPMSVWVRIIDLGSGNVRLAVAYNVAVANKNNLPVFVRPTRKRGRRPYEVVGIALLEIDASRTRSFDIGPHAPEHQWPDGSDIISIDSRQIFGLRAREQDVPNMTLQVDEGWYDRYGLKFFEGGNSPTFVKPPPPLLRWDLLVINNQDELEIIEGVPGIYEEITYPTPPGDAVLLAAVLLTFTMSGITERSMRDLRFVPTVVSEDLPPHRSGDHVHITKEDKSSECNGSKVMFVVANIFEEQSLQVMLNGLDQRMGSSADYVEGAMLDSFTMSTPPVSGDTLQMHYLARLT